MWAGDMHLLMGECGMWPPRFLAYYNHCFKLDALLRTHSLNVWLHYINYVFRWTGLRRDFELFAHTRRAETTMSNLITCIQTHLTSRQLQLAAAVRDVTSHTSNWMTSCLPWLWPWTACVPWAAPRSVAASRRRRRATTGRPRPSRPATPAPAPTVAEIKAHNTARSLLVTWQFRGFCVCVHMGKHFASVFRVWVGALWSALFGNVFICGFWDGGKTRQRGMVWCYKHVYYNVHHVQHTLVHQLLVTYQ